MERRKFLTSAALAGITGSALAAPAIAQTNSKTMTIVSTWPRDFPGLGTSAQRVAARITELTQGAITTEYYAAGERVGAFDSFDEVAAGNSQAYIGADYYWVGKHPAFAFFTSVPFGMVQSEFNAWIKYGGGQAYWDKLSGEFGVKALPCGATGTQAGGWFNKEINSLEDIKGLKMRFPGFGGEVFKRAGGIPVNIPGGELYTAMQTGTIDAVEWVGPYNDLAFGFQQVAKYYYYPGWHEPGSMLEFTINIDAWNTLPPHLQAIVTTAAKAVNQDLLDEYTASNNRALQDLIQNHDVQLRELPKDVINEFRIISEEILETSAANDPDVKKVYESFKTFLAEVKSFHAIAEDAFVEARTNSDSDS